MTTPSALALAEYRKLQAMMDAEWPKERREGLRQAQSHMRQCRWEVEQLLVGIVHATMSEAELTARLEAVRGWKTKATMFEQKYIQLGGPAYDALLRKLCDLRTAAVKAFTAELGPHFAQ